MAGDTHGLHTSGPHHAQKQVPHVTQWPSGLPHCEHEPTKSVRSSWCSAVSSEPENRSTLVALASSSDMGRIVRWRRAEAPVSVPSPLEDAAGDDARERLAKAPARRRCFCSVIFSAHFSSCS